MREPCRTPRLAADPSTTSTSFEPQRLASRRALRPRIASGVGRTQGGGGSRLAFGLCRPAPAVLVMARKLRPALVCAPPRHSRRLPHNAPLAEELPRDWGRETGRGIFGPVFPLM